MSEAVLNTVLTYENNWVEIKEIQLDGIADRLLAKEVKEAFFNEQETWKKEDALKSALNNIHFPKFTLPDIEKEKPNTRHYKLPEGISLMQLIEENTLTMAERMSLATEILGVVNELHTKEHLLCDVNPFIFWCDMVEERIFLLDVVMTVPFANIGNFYSSLLSIDPQVNCMSPEQSLQTPFVPDFRSNYYSIGAILYGLFTGVYPLVGNERLAIIHKHLSKIPLPPESINDEIVPALGSFLLKLLAKDPKERYQSFNGLIQDFNICKHLQLKRDYNTIPELGTSDFPLRFGIPNNIFHRPETQEKLLELTASVVKGEKHMVIIHREEGAGAHYVIDNLFQNLGMDKFFTGTGSMSKDNSIPFKGLKDLTSSILQQVLMEDALFIEDLKNDLQENIGSLSGVLIDFDPDFEHFFTKKELPDDLFGNAAINRFSYAFTEFLRVLELQGKSIIIGLERFEYVDLGTSKLISQLAKSSFIHNILIILTVERDKDKHNEHCKDLLDGLNQNFHLDEAINTHNLLLENYGKREIANMLESLKIVPQEEFAELIYQKTKGNLSFIKQLFEELVSQDYIKPDSANQVWKIDLPSVRNIDLSDNIREFLNDRINQLGEDELTALKIAVNMGQDITVEHLAKIVPYEKEKFEDVLNSLRKQGFLTPIEYEHARVSRLKFAHSLIPEILKGILSETELESYKLAILKSQIEALNEEQINARLYELMALLMPLKAEFCIGYAHYLESAGHKAKKEAAFKNASDYFNKLVAIEKIQDTVDPDKIFSHAYEATLCALYAMEYNHYHKLLRQLQDLVVNENHGFRIYLLKAIESVQRGDHQGTLNVLSEGMKAMGIKFPLNISKAEIIKLFFICVMKSRNINSNNVSDLPFNDSEKQTIYHQLINIASPAVYFLKPELTSRMTYLGVRDTLKHGIIPQSPYHLVALGFMMNSFSNMTARAQEVCRAGFKLQESKMVNKQIAIPQNFLYSSFIQHTEQPLVDCVESLEKCYKKGRELGNINMAHYCLGMNRWYLLFDGKPLDQLSELLEASHKLSRDDNQKLINRFYKLIKTLIQELRRGYFFKEALEDKQLTLTKEAFNDEIYKEDRILYSNLQMIKLIVDAGNDKVCRDKEFLLELLNSVKEGGHGSYNAIVHIFYGLYHILKTDKEERALSGRAITKFLNILKTRAKTAPSNYRTKFVLLSALKANQEGNIQAARQLFEDAYITSLEYGNPWDIALCSEGLGKFLMKTDSPGAGRSKLAEAISYYKQWGATSIANRLLHQHPELTEKITPLKSVGVDASENSIAEHGLANLVELSRSVNKNDDLESLVSKLFNFIYQEISLTKAVFLIKNEADYTLFAASEGLADLNISERKAVNDDLPLSIIRLADRRKGPLVLDNASIHSQFRSDTYVSTKKTKSVLCIPFVRTNTTRSLLYLEHNQLEALFSKELAELINLMFSQVAVAMDNAVLTEMLEEKLAQRSHQIAQEKEKSDLLIQNILPKKVADELKQSGKVKARKYDNVSVLFTDFKDFTLFSEQLSAEQIIEELDHCFKAFDDIIEEFHLEKIKTIGDAYMCAGGIPDPNPGHEYKMIEAGLKMIAYIDDSNKDRKSRGIPPLLLRVGIHSGPLIAGVVGSKKYAYDIWGPTVNIASRMEAAGEPNKINISGAVYLKVKDQYHCQYRGKISAKNVGEIDMYFVERRK